MSRHWCPQSQRYAGGDALLTYLYDGWEIRDEVYYEEYWQGGARRMFIYDFVLVNADQRVTMHVIDNPFVERLLRELPVRVLPRAATRPQVSQSRRRVQQLH
jgi:hypothetical protein